MDARIWMRLELGQAQESTAGWRSRVGVTSGEADTIRGASGA
jgi:hypothetical protein